MTPAKGGQFSPASHGQINPALGGQFNRRLHPDAGIFAKSHNSAVDNIINYKNWDGQTKMTLNMASGTGLLGINTTAPTHTLTLASASTGTAIYNTADQTANYERLRMFWNANAFNINTEKGGTGSYRNIVINGVTFGGVGYNPNLSAPIASFGTLSPLGVGAGMIYGQYATNTQSQGSINQHTFINNVNQSGSAGYSSARFVTYEQAVGSGDRSLFEVGRSSAANGGGTFTSALKVSGSGYVGVGSNTPTHPLTMDSTNMVKNGGIALYSTADQTTNYQRLNIKMNSSNIAKYDLQSGGTGTTPGYHSFQVNGAIVFKVDSAAAFTKGLNSVADNVYDIGRLNSSPYRFRSMYLGTSAQIGRAANTAINARMDLGGSTTTLAQIMLADGVAPANPVDGMIWRVGSEVFIRLGGVTKKMVLTTP